MVGAISRFVLRHKWQVILFWVILTVVGLAGSKAAADALSSQFSVPGKEGFTTNQEILQRYGNGGIAPPIIPVVTLPAGQTVNSPGVRDQLAQLDKKIVSAEPSVRLASYASTGDSAFVSKDGKTVFSLIYVPFLGQQIPQQEIAIRNIVNHATIDGAPAHLTGLIELETPSDSSANNNGPGVLVEALLGGLGALVVLVFVFASFLALIPIFMAVAAIATTFLLIWGLTTFAEVSFIVQFLVALIGLGVAIDYSLLIITRWREECDRGLDNNAAVQKAMETAGPAVAFSGTTVGIGLLALVVLPVPFLRSVGYAGMLIPLVSVIVALTLLPVVLATVGPKMAWPRIRKEVHASRGWDWWARFVVRRRWPAATTAAIVVLLLVIPAFHLTVGTPSADSLAQSGPARDGLISLENSGVGTGVFTPLEILLHDNNQSKVTQAVAKVSGIAGAVSPLGSQWQRPPSHGQPAVSLIEVLPKFNGDTSEGRDLVTTVRTVAKQVDTSARVGGESAQSADFVDAVYGNFPLMIMLVVVITFILLVRAFHSLLLPLKAVLLNMVSLAAAYGILVLVWQEGYGSKQIWGISPSGAIAEWIPIMVFAFLFGLSMDYEVFILARMREEYDATHNTNEAVVRGVGRTGRLVTSAALILFLAFISLASGPETTIKTFATALAAGILFDATVIRAILVPALVSLFGSWNWWLPHPLKKLLRVKAVSLEPAEQSFSEA